MIQVFEAIEAALRVVGWFARGEFGEREDTLVSTEEGRRRLRDSAASIISRSEDTIPSETQPV